VELVLLDCRRKFVQAPLECMCGTICGTHGHLSFLILELFAKNGWMVMTTGSDDVSLFSSQMQVKITAIC
jgi:hypothetical protein